MGIWPRIPIGSNEPPSSIREPPSAASFHFYMAAPGTCAVESSGGLDHSFSRRTLVTESMHATCRFPLHLLHRVISPALVVLLNRNVLRELPSVR